jgi:hypothetical protein
LSREYYLVNIPTTDSAFAALNTNAELALNNMGLIYRNDLKDYERANESFKTLIKRYPASPYLLSSYYNLYSIARDQNNQAMVDYYKNTIISQFPESMYAKVLSNPDYFRQLEAQERAVQLYYEQTYDIFKAGNYTEVVIRSEYALKTYPGHALIPQFAYLGALAKGEDSDQQEFRVNLMALVQMYPGTDVASDAQILIDYMNREHPEMKEAEEVILSQKLYQVSGNEPHLFAYVLDRKIDANQLVFNIINFNLDNFDQLNLRVDIAELNTTQKLIIVKPFPDKITVMQYFSSITSSKAIFKDMPAVSLMPVSISESNYSTLKEDKSIDRYLKFYNETYP